MRSRKIGTLLLFLIALATGFAKECRLDKLEECGLTESCIQKAKEANIGECQCLEGFERLDGKGICTVAVVDQGGSSTVAFVFLALFLICLFAGIIYLNYKYRLFNLIQYKFHQRYNRNYDDVMIGQEDD